MYRRWLVVVAAVWLLAGGSAYGVGIVLNPTPYNAFGHLTSGVFDEEEHYTCPDGRAGRTWLDPYPPNYVNAAGSLWEDDMQTDPTVFYDVFQNEFGGSFMISEALNELAGQFHVYTYDAVGTPAAVGADFHVAYVPAAGENFIFGGGSGGNTTDGLHWVQMIHTNHPLRGPGAGTHTGGSDYLDVSDGQGNPYYDDGGAAGPGFTPGATGTPDSYHLYDAPRRVDTCLDHYWLANLYLVNQSTTLAGKEIEILGGVQWGWRNAVTPIVPEPTSIALLLIGVGAMACRKW